MNKKRTFAFFICPIFVWTTHAQMTTLTTSEEIIQKLITTDFRVAFDGVSDYMGFLENEQTPDSNSALVQALKNENERIRSIWLKQGEDFPLYQSEGDGESLLFLEDAVYQLQDSATISVLLPWCDDEMIDFERQAFEPVLRFVEEPSSGTTRYDTGSCLDALLMMVDHWNLRSFSSFERQRMKQVASKYIENSEFYSMRYAISLSHSL